MIAGNGLRRPLPIVAKVQRNYSPAVADRITKLDEILWPPYDKIAPNIRAWLERWNKEVER